MSLDLITVARQQAASAYQNANRLQQEADQARVQATQEDRRATRIEETADTAHHRYQTARIRVEDLEKQYAQPMYAIDSTESTLDFVRRSSIA